MSRLNHVQTILSELTSKLGLGAVELDASDSSSGGRVTLQVGEAPLVFSYSATPADLLWLHVDLGAVPITDTEAHPGQPDPAAEFLLQAGFQAWMLAGITIALDDHGGRAMAFTAVPATTLSIESLETSLRQLMETALPLRRQLAAEDWRVELPQAEDEVSAAPGLTDSGGPMSPPAGMLRP